MNKFLSGSTQTTALGRPRTFLNIVLDESSSMCGVADVTRKAYNDFILQQRAASVEAKDEVFVTLTKFSSADRVTTVYAQRPLASVDPLTAKTYGPNGGTALYDGIWGSIEAMEKAVGENARVLTLVITDGEENCSRKIVDIDVLKRIVETREARGNWTFVFLSAGSNPFNHAAGMGFKAGNVQTYSAGDVGMALVRVGKAVADYRKSDDMQSATFWAGAAPQHEKPEWHTTAADEAVEDVV